MGSVILVIMSGDYFSKEPEKIEFQRMVRGKILTNGNVIKFLYLKKLNQDLKKLIKKIRPNIVFLGNGMEKEKEVLDLIMFLTSEIKNVTLLSEMEMETKGIKKIGRISEIKNYANELSPV